MMMTSAKMTSERKYRNENWLREKYLEEDLEYDEIAEECSVKGRTVQKYIKEYNIGRYKCEVVIDGGECGKKFKTERSLNNHKTIVHKNDSSWNKWSSEERKHHDPNWIQEKLERGLSQREIAEECRVTYNSIRRVVRENNLGIVPCPVGECSVQKPTEEGILQHLSREHPEHPYDSHGLDTEKVKASLESWRKEALESGEHRFKDSEYQKWANKKVQESDYDHSEFMKEYMNNLGEGEYPAQQEGWWDKYAESRDSWGPNYQVVEETGHEVASGWEEEIDLMLYENGIEYEYEGKTFTIGDTWNTPDFIGDDWIIEVKSPAGYRDKERLDRVGEYLKSEVDGRYIIVGEGIEMPCNDFVEWEEREEVLNLIPSSE